MMLRTFHIVLFLFSVSVVAQASQQEILDSLRKIVREAKTDSAWVKAQYDLGARYYAVDQDSCLELCLHGANVCKWYLESAKMSEIDYYSHRLMLYCNLIGAVYGGRGQHQQSLNFFDITLRIGTQREDFRIMALINNNYGSIFQRQGKHRSALKRFLKSAEIRDKFLEGSDKTYVTLNIGEVHETLADSCINAGNLSEYKEQMSLARKYYEDAKIYSENDGQIPGLAAAYAKSANLQRKWGHLTAAKEEIIIALSHVTQAGLQNTTPLVYRHAAWVYYDLGIFRTAIEYGELALEGGRKLKSADDIVYSCEILAKSYEAIGNSSAALMYYEMFVDEGHILHNEIQKRNEIEQTYRLAYAKKVAADSTRMANESYVAMAEIASREAEIRINRAQKVGMWVIIIALIGLIIITYLRSKRNRKDHAVILKQKSKVEYQQKKILDSLYYAE
jgi:tetratricopeptide (TPR) repeat protein